MTFQILLPEATWKHKTEDALQNYLCMHAVWTSNTWNDASNGNRAPMHFSRNWWCAPSSPHSALWLDLDRVSKIWSAILGLFVYLGLETFIDVSDHLKWCLQWKLCTDAVLTKLMTCTFFSTQWLDFPFCLFCLDTFRMYLYVHSILKTHLAGIDANSTWEDDFLVYSNSPNKRTNNKFIVVVKTNSFIRFLGKFKDTKSPFETIWRLVLKRLKAA